MAALHNAVVRRQRQFALQAGVALGLVVVKLLTHHLDVGDLKVVSTELALVLEEHVTIGHGRAVGQVAPHQVVDRVDALRIHGDALQAIGDLDGHGSTSMPPTCWKYVNCVTSMPLSQTSQPRPQAPSVGLSQSSSTKRTSWSLGSRPMAASEPR